MPEENLIRDKSDFELDYRIVHPEKGVRDINVVGHAVLDHAGDFGAFVGAVIDITERKRAEQELQQLVDLVPQLIVCWHRTASGLTQIGWLGNIQV